MRLATALLGMLLTACTVSLDVETSSTVIGESSTSLTDDTTSQLVDSSTTTSEAQSTTTTTLAPENLVVAAFPVPSGSRPHDVAPAANGGVWYTAQNLGELGWLDPETGETRHIPLGLGSRPHGVIVADDGTPWITDGGLNAIVSVDPDTDNVTVYPLPDADPANLNTAVFDDDGILWFTGQAGRYGSLDPASDEMSIYQSPRGSGPYGITSTPDGRVFFASLAGSYVGEIISGGEVSVLEPPTSNQGARRVWTDSTGDIWVSEWNSGNLSRFAAESGEWTTWPLPGDDPSTYAVFVDDVDIVWLSDFGANALVRFDPELESFTVYPLPHSPGDVRQIHGRPGEVWGAESAADHLVLIRTR